MYNGYERAAKEIIPAIRVALIKELRLKYNVKEEVLSEYLGITQAAVSKYINGKYSNRVKRIEAGIDRGVVESYAKRIFQGGEKITNKSVCAICQMLNTFNCSFSNNKTV